MADIKFWVWQGENDIEKVYSKEMPLIPAVGDIIFLPDRDISYVVTKREWVLHDDGFYVDVHLKKGN